MMRNSEKGGWRIDFPLLRRLLLHFQTDSKRAQGEFEPRLRTSLYDGIPKRIYEPDIGLRETVLTRSLPEVSTHSS